MAQLRSTMLGKNLIGDGFEWLKEEDAVESPAWIDHKSREIQLTELGGGITSQEQ